MLTFLKSIAAIRNILFFIIDVILGWLEFYKFSRTNNFNETGSIYEIMTNDFFKYTNKYIKAINDFKKSENFDLLINYVLIEEKKETEFVKSVVIEDISETSCLNIVSNSKILEDKLPKKLEISFFYKFVSFFFNFFGLNGVEFVENFFKNTLKNTFEFLKGSFKIKTLF